MCIEPLEIYKSNRTAIKRLFEPELSVMQTLPHMGHLTLVQASCNRNIVKTIKLWVTTDLGLDFLGYSLMNLWKIQECSQLIILPLTKTNVLILFYIEIKIEEIFRTLIVLHYFPDKLNVSAHFLQ